MRRVIKLPVIGEWFASQYRPTYRESSYQRPFYQRLTPLTRFALVVVAIAVLAIGLALINQWRTAQNGTGLLSDRVPTRPTFILSYYDSFSPGFIVTYYQTPAPIPTPETVVSSAKPAAVATLAPTSDMSRAPWAGQLTKAPDGTLIAPQPVVAKAVQDLSGYYSIQRNLGLEDYITTREEILRTYFTGSALEYMHSLELYQDQYAMNRAGRFSVEVRQFSPDGLSAKAGVIKRDWVNDIYNLSSKQLVTQGKVQTDTLTLTSVVFDPTGGKWKFSSVDQVIELKK
jgi:hypothetical protein